MKSRTVYILLALVCLMASGIALIEWRRLPAEASVRRENRILSIHPESIDAITFRKGATTVALVKEGSRWSLREPIRWPASNTEVEKLLSHLYRLKKKAVITEKEMQSSLELPHAYGLASPAGVLEVSAGTRIQRIEIGRVSHAGDHVYVRSQPSFDIIAVDTNFLECLPDHPAPYRSRRVFPLDIMQVRRVEVKQSGGFVQLHRNGDGQWLLEQPYKWRAMTRQVDQWLQGVVDIQVHQFIDGNTEDLSAYGVDEWSPSIRLLNDAKNVDFSLTLGGEVVEEGVRYALFSPGKILLKVPSYVSEWLSVSPDAWRERRLFSFHPESIRAVELTGEESTVKLRRRGADWMLMEPFQSDADHAHIRMLMQHVAEARILQFMKRGTNTLDQTGLSRSERMIRLWTENDAMIGVTQQVAFSIGEPASDHTVWVTAETSPWIYEVTNHVLWTGDVNVLHYMTPEVLSLSPDQVARISRRMTDSDESVQRLEDGLFKYVGDGKRRVDVHHVRRVLQVLQSLKAQQYVGTAAGHMERYGLDRAEIELTIGLTAKGDGLMKVLLIGAETESGERYAFLRGFNYVFTLDRTVCSALALPLTISDEEAGDQDPVSSEDKP